MNLTLCPMADADLPVVAAWLLAPHVARWWTEDPAQEIAGYARCIRGEEPTQARMVHLDGWAVGWCQWYRWADYPAGEYGAGPQDVGLDYAIGEAPLVGRGVGTAMIAALVAEVGRERPHAPLLVSVDAENTASRRVLEKNGFALVELREIPSEPEDRSALYRLGRSIG
ncbi:MAG: GNAT family N-acetyltransferase [Jatrophihabitantaceae bacterium]